MSIRINILLVALFYIIFNGAALQYQILFDKTMAALLLLPIILALINLAGFYKKKLLNSNKVSFFNQNYNVSNFINDFLNSFLMAFSLFLFTSQAHNPLLISSPHALIDGYDFISLIIENFDMDVQKFNVIFIINLISFGSSIVLKASKSKDYENIYLKLFLINTFQFLVIFLLLYL